LGQKNITIQILTERNLQLSAQILSLKQEVQRLHDVEKQLSVANDVISSLTESKLRIQKDLEVASDYLLEQESKTYKANKTSLELLKQLKDAEIEIETLKNYIIELKQRIAVYIPMKDDPVDKKLAEFINNYPERSKLKIMFMRESEGVYQFGTKRVYVRVDKDKINSKFS
jgi:esterase/lipase